MANGTNQANNPSMARIALVLVVLVLALSVLAILYGQKAYDYFKAQSFTPSSEIANVSERLKLTSYGQTLFYASSPTLQDQKLLNANCQSAERTVAILGCYYKRDIHLFDVTNSELDGAKEVTAAHEMLHAAYDRLNVFERQRVNRLLEEEYARVNDDPDLQKLMSYYQNKEPGAELNELHSIIGTTIENISPDLEKYYGQYFEDRDMIVEMNRNYTEVFKRLDAEADDLSVKINTLGEGIEKDSENYEADRAQLELDVNSFNERASSGDYGTRAEFNSARQLLVARIANLTSRQQEINTRIDEYNSYVSRLNELSVRVSELNQGINGVAAPEPSL